MPRIKWSGVKDPVPVPPGWYTVVVAKGTDRTTAKNNDDMISLTYEILDEGDYKGEKVFDNLVFTEGALPNVKVALEAMGMELSDDVDFEASDLVGRTLMIRTKMGEYQGQKRPEVEFRGYKATEVAAPEINADEAPEQLDDIGF